MDKINELITFDINKNNLLNSNSSLTIFWHRRDLRIDDNAGLYHALKWVQSRSQQADKSHFVQSIFIFDPDILNNLEKNDLRVLFIYQTLETLKYEYQKNGSDLWVFYGKANDVFDYLTSKFIIKSVFTNHDYEPKAIRRDQDVEKLLIKKEVLFKTYKDQTIFEKNEVLSDLNKSYTIYTPYKKKWLSLLNSFYLKPYPVNLYKNFLSKIKSVQKFISLEQIGFIKQKFSFPSLELSTNMLKNYSDNRDFPFLSNGTSLLGLHLRFGTVSIRELAKEGQKHSDVWLSELIWRDFFQQILWFYPYVETKCFRPAYDSIQWRDDFNDFEKWKNGETGYPLVDAGMRELNATGHMHNRVRMVVASFLTKHLLHHWYKGERYFASKLLDYDLSANNGNWQWAAGTGCDAAPYFRIFNPTSQQERFDPKGIYIKKWVPEWGTSKQLKPMIDHNFARDRALMTYKQGLGK